METSVSRKCLRRRTAQMLERSQSPLQYHNNIAGLQDWYSTDHRSHTPRQDEGDEPLMDLVKDCSPDIDIETRRDHGRQEHRNRPLSALIVNIVMDVQAE